jgi:hypothetical protein
VSQTADCSWRDALKCFIWASAKDSPTIAITRMAAPTMSAGRSSGAGLRAAISTERLRTALAGAWMIERPNIRPWNERPHSVRRPA